MSLAFVERFRPVFVQRRRYRGGNANKIWSAGDILFLGKLAREGNPAASIAADLERTIGAVRLKARACGIKVVDERKMPAAPVSDDAECEGVPSPVKAIALAAAERHGVAYSDIVGPCRKPVYARPRQEAMWLAARDTAKSYPQIARVFDRDHTTVIHAIRRQNRLRGANVRGLGTDKSKPNGRKK